jgi:hypothetical protein
MRVTEERESADARRKPDWPDLLTAILLVPLGLGAVGYGLLCRAALGKGFISYETIALLIIAGGLAALQGGSARAVALVFPRLWMLEDETCPTIRSGFPFLALGFSCLMLGAFLPERRGSISGTAFVLLISGAGGIMLALLVPLAMALGRAAVQRRQKPDKQK